MTQPPTAQPDDVTPSPENAARPVFYDANHEHAVKTGQDYYIDTATGFLVWTENYHLKRGYCCQSACRHCPFGFRSKCAE